MKTIERACLRTGGRSDSDLNPRNIYTEARKMERRIAHALLAIEAKREGNADAATRTSDKNAAAWSAGVAKGLEIAAGFLEPNSQFDRVPPITSK